MSDDKNDNGAYINNPEFPYKNLNIDKIEKIRRTGSLNTQISSEKKQNNDDTNKNGNAPKQSGLRSLGSVLSKKLSMSKNFIERNIEKIAILSKKNDKNAQKNKTNNKNNTTNCETQKDGKKDTKDIKNNILNSGVLKNKNASNSTGANKAGTAQISDNIIANNNRNNNNNQNNSSHRNTILSDMNKNENVLNKGQNKNTENDIVKSNNSHNKTFYNTNLMEAKNYEISKKSQKTNEKCSKEHSYYDFERPKNIVKNLSTNYEDNNINIFHKKQKTILNEETTNTNCKNKIMNNMMGKGGDEDQRKTTLSLLKQSGSNDILKSNISGRTHFQNDFRENDDARKGKHINRHVSDINEETIVDYKNKGGSIYQPMDQEEIIIKMKESSKLIGSNETFKMKNIIRTKSEQDKLKNYSELVKKERNTYNENYNIYNMETTRSSNRNTDYGSYNISIYENRSRNITKNENIYGKDSRTDSIYSIMGKVKRERGSDDHEEDERRNDYEMNQINNNSQKENNSDNEQINLNIPISHNDSNTYSSIIIRKKKIASVENPLILDDPSVNPLINYNSNNNKEYELENGNKKKDGPKNIRNISNMGSEFYSEKSKNIENFREIKIKKEKSYFYNIDNQKDNFQGMEKNGDNGDVIVISDNEMELNSHFKRAGDRTNDNQNDRKKYSENINGKISYNNVESNSTVPKYGDKSSDHISYEHEKVCEEQTKERYKNIEDININNVSKLTIFSNISSNKKSKINDGDLSSDQGEVFYEGLSKYSETPNDHNNKMKYIKKEITEEKENNNNDYDDDYLNSNYCAVSSSRKADPGFSDAFVTPSCENNFEGDLQNDKVDKDYENMEKKNKIVEKKNEFNDEKDRENHDKDRISNIPEKNNYYKLEINDNELNNKNEVNNNFLHSSSDSYNPNMANIYSRISNDANTKKNNKLVNKNLIMKELFGSNYESSLKNDLNESSNILNESSCAGWSEEGKPLEGGDKDIAEKKGVENEEKSVNRYSVGEDTQKYVLEGENEIKKGVEDKRDENKEEENKITRKEGHQMYEYIEELNEENDNTYGESLNDDKSIVKESEEMHNKFHLKKNGNNIKDIFDIGLENDEDSLLKKYEENASPRILSKPNFNNRTSESSYYKSDIINQSKKISLNSRSDISFMGKERIDEINYCENGQRENFHDSSNKYNMNKEYISKKESHDINKSPIEMKKYRNMSNNCNDENGEYTDNFDMDRDADKFYDAETEKENISKRGQNNIIDRRNMLSNKIGRRSEGQSHDEEILKHDEKNSKNSKNYTYSDYIKRGGNHYYKIFERNQVNNYEGKIGNESVNNRADFNENENNKMSNLLGKSKLSKYIDNKFLIYKNNLFNNKNESNLERDMMYRSEDKNDNINEDYVDDEKKHLIDYTSNNSSYIVEKKNSTDSTGTLLNGDNLDKQNRMMQNVDMKSSISDDYYLDYIKRQGYNEKNRIECDSGARSCDEKYMEHNDNVDVDIKDKTHMMSKKKRKSNNEENNLTYNTKDRIKYDNHSNSRNFFDGIERSEKKKKKSMLNNVENMNSINDDNSLNMMGNMNSIENMSNPNNLNSIENMSNPNNLNSMNNLSSMNNLNSSLSYRRSECSKAELYSSINETRNSSQTIVSKRSKYALKQSNASSILDEIPTLFNFVNCCSIILGSEIIYVTDETYGKCENILKDKPFHSNVERGYYEFCSNDLYNVLDDKLKSSVGKGNRHGKSETEERKKKKNRNSYYNTSQKCDDYNFDEKNDLSIGKNEECNKFSQFEEVSKYRECPGWLTKRRIKKYFDFCIVKLCKPTLIKGIDIDTNNFLGNYAPYVSIEGAYIEDDDLMSSEAFSKYVEKIKIENKIKRDKRRASGIQRNTSNDVKNDDCDDNDTFSYYKQKEKNGINNMSIDRINPFSDAEGTQEYRQDMKHKKRSLSTERGSHWSDKGSENNLSRSKEEIEIMINGKRYFQRNKYFYEPILIDPTDKSSEEYENYVEIIKYNENLKQLKDGNMKPTSFVANGNEYRCIENKLYTLIDVTREIASKYPDIHSKALIKKLSNDAKIPNELNGEYSSESVHKCGDQSSNDFFKGKIENSDDDEFYNDILDGYSCNTLYLDNDYSVEKRIYNTLHKKYQWVSILEDERMNPGFKNYNHNCFNINTCNKIFTHLIVCLLPDGGINKLRVYGEIKISKNEKQKNYKKIINVSNILDGSNVVYTTDEFYGKSDNILIDQNSKYVMGWQTRRLINRPLRYVDNLQLNNISSIFYNNNYCIIKLSYITNVKYIEINTIFYEYNFPLCISIDHCYVSDIHAEEKSKQMKYFSDNIHNIEWKELLPLSYIKGNHINYFTINSETFNDESSNSLPSSHLRLNIYPDGGINTIKVFGTVLEV
ncbi:conserved Plasmodium protein, unknown function [Plasmodium yoelii]|uniref:Allantoicase n=3 Tax=Plasmodium yoelii TaxID=5861 RepID=A0AAE9WQT7_PLAYO|nr:conserved Plasmodium protein, unknown function [Plasmodium yoelii]EAA20813.1 hypothetical protein [Plasmodium yoelii yoelii]WBY54814.1 allantoicase [Plasmodium yoelii yoelii]CDU16160.1 conserved Plasmodium protein, unknown function [Plasmodium yoelii]VTZ71790.1 conserved Plasmodium protein, unknown function [Plasmodium yoelii]|eukprot:XP_729248.1 conserved Plasmodium protein, unknown function [Plasmodium yoelii]